MPWMLVAIALLVLALALAGCRGKRSPPSIGAMCYEVAAAPTTGAYVCPVCGNRTMYPLGSPEDQLQSRLAESRRLVQELGIAWITLDESEFCRTCKPDISSPHAVLVVLHPVDTTPMRVRDVAPEQLVLLRKLMLDLKPTGKATPTAEDFERVRKVLQPEGAGKESPK